MKPRKYEVTTAQILRDIESLIDGIFEAETEKTGECILLNFTNGRQFLISVHQIRNTLES